MRAPLVALTRQESFAPRRGTEKIPPYLEEAKALFGVLQDGAPGGGYHIRRAPCLRDAVTRRHIPSSYTDVWQPAREVAQADGQRIEADRTLNSWVLAQVLRGTYDVAWQAPSWTSLVVLDIDRRFAPGDGRSATLEIDADLDLSHRLAAVWDAFGFDAEQQPVVLQSPGGGYHVYIPLARPRPAKTLRSAIHAFLAARGIEISPGRLEIFPAGQRLRVPCGRGMGLLVPRQPDDPDELRLELRHARVVHRDGRPTVVRDVRALVTGFLDRLADARRPLDQWLSDERHAYGKAWGPWGVRIEKMPSPPPGPVALSQHSWRSSSPAPGGAESSSEQPRLLYGTAFRAHVERLLREGLWQEGLRHDALLKLAFYFCRTVGASRERFRLELAEWLDGFAHVSKDRDRNPGQFVRQSLREGLHYFDQLEAGGPVRGSVRGERHLVEADERILEHADRRVHKECIAVLRHLRSHAAEDGQVGDTVNLSCHVLKRLCGERRVVQEVEGGPKRRRATVVAVEELVRLGVLVLHQKHLAGRHGRLYTCWYRFGSGRLPRASNGAHVVATRLVDEGRLEALSRDGSPALRLVVTSRRVVEEAPQRGAYRPWWQSLYRRAFTPAEFAVDATVSVIRGPWERGRDVPLELAFEVAELPPGATAARSGESPVPRDLPVAGAQLRLFEPDLERGLAASIGAAWRALCGS